MLKDKEVLKGKKLLCYYDTMKNFMKQLDRQKDYRKYFKEALL